MITSPKQLDQVKYFKIYIIVFLTERCNYIKLDIK